MMPERDGEERITRVLEDAPAVTVPADFTTMVMARLPQRRTALYGVLLLRRRTHYGRNAMLAGAVLLCGLLVFGAVTHQATAAWQLAEWIILAQLAGIVLWRGLAAQRT
jgi:hypothetical protein